MRHCLASLCVLFLAATNLLAGDAKKPPNILFLFADDMRAGVIGAHGNPHVITPNLDRLAKGGTSFLRNYIMGGNQGAVCVPSRAMMLSGKSMYTIPTTTLADVTTWPILLRRAGYITHMTGKWHNGGPSATANFPGAKNVFLGGMSNQFAVKVNDMPKTGAFQKKDAGRVGDKHSSELFADEAIRFLKEKKAAPWTLYVAFTAPHDPREAPKDWHKKFDPTKIPVPPNYLPEHPFDNGELKVRDEKLEAWPRTKEAIQKHLADYYAIIGHMDAEIGRILAALEAAGELDNTIIIFASDNGLAIGSHGLMGKQSVYDHSVRVPLIIGGPGLPKDRKSEALTYLLDLCPTICEFAGIAPPEGIHGKSLVQVLKDGRVGHRDELLFAYRDLQRGIMDARWHAIHYMKIDRWQLFDFQNDPDELRDLVADPNHAATLRSLKERLPRLRAEFGDAK